MTRRRALISTFVLLLLGGVVGVAGVWFLFFNGSPPPAAALDDAADSVATPAASAVALVEGASGTWAVDTAIGSYSDYSSTFAGFRVSEVLQGIGETAAIGRTPDVTGSLTIDGQMLSDVTIEVGLTSITSDRPRRDGAIQRTLETSAFPTATYELSEPIELPSEPVEGVTYALSADGSMTIHGVTQQVTADLDARLVNGVIVIVGTVPFTFRDYGMVAPTAPIVLSVSDSGLIEFQLYFTR